MFLFLRESRNWERFTTKIKENMTKTLLANLGSIKTIIFIDQSSTKIKLFDQVFYIIIIVVIIIIIVITTTTTTTTTTIIIIIIIIIII